MGAPGTQAFLKALEGQSPQAAPVRYSNARPSYRTPPFPGAPSGVIPAGARVNPQPPMTQYQQNLTPMGKRILQSLATKKDEAEAAPTTPGAGQVDLGGQPKGTDSFMSRLMTPQSQGMLSAAAAGLEASGWQDRPVSLGQVLGRMGAAGMKAYGAAEDREAAKAAASQKAVVDRLLAEAQYAKATKGEKPVFKMLPSDDGSGSTQLTMIDPRTGEKLGTVGGVKPPSGMSLSVDKDGNLVLTQGVGGNMQKTTRKNLEESILSAQGSLALMDKAYEDFDPNLLTYKSDLESFFGKKIAKADPDLITDAMRQKLQRRSDLVQTSQQVFSRILKDLSGAAVTKFELENAKNFSISPDDDPITFKSKLTNQRAITRAALYRAQNLLSGEDLITEDLARKYPISIRGKDSRGNTKTLYIDQFVDKYMSLNNVDQPAALRAYAEAAKEARQ